MKTNLFKGKTAVIVCHDFIYGPPHELRDYLLRNNIDTLLFIGHQNRYVKPNMIQSSYFEIYTNGVLKYKFSSIPITLPEPIAYIRDFLMTLYWSLTKIHGPIHFFIGAGNLNAFAGLLFRAIGLVQISIYYAIDYVPIRLENALLNFLYHGIDYLCAKYSNSTWNYGKGMINHRSTRWKRIFPHQQIVPNGIRFRQGTIVDTGDIHKHEIVYMGTLFAHQGILIVIQALKKIRLIIPDASLVIIGGGEYGDKLKIIVSQLGLSDSVVFLGFIPDPLKMDKIIAHAAIGVATYNPNHPFVKNSEPGKVKRYLACGIPVLMTNISPIANELVKNKCGFITSYRVNEIARQIINYFKDEKMAQQYRINAVTYAKKYDWNSIYTKAFEQLTIK